MNKLGKETVAVIGASNNPERYSNKAIKMLLEYGHVPVPVSPGAKKIEGIDAVASVAEIDSKIDTLTLYVGPSKSLALADDIIRLRPGRVIMNPGAENQELADRLHAAGIPVENACTLVLLRTGQF